MDPLAEGTHLIHIGPQKTGSTAIQAALHRSREELRAHGVVYPGPQSKPREAAEVGLGFARIAVVDRSTEAWDDLLRQVDDPDAQRVCVSLEAFGRATDEQIERIVEHLGGSSPHILAVARRYDALLPSQWQQRVKSQLQLAYDDWLAILLGDDQPEDQHWANFWIPHDTVSLVRRWTRAVGPDRFTLVVADESDRELLSRTFEQLLGVPEGMLRDQGGRANTSLSYPQVELLRQLNVVFHEQDWLADPWFDLVKTGVVPALLAQPEVAGTARVPPMPAWAWPRLVELSDRRVDGLRELGVRTVGDLDGLRVVPTPDADHEAPLTDVPVSVAVAALRGMAEAAERRHRADRRRLRRARKQPD